MGRGNTNRTTSTGATSVPTTTASYRAPRYRARSPVTWVLASTIPGTPWKINATSFHVHGGITFSALSNDFLTRSFWRPYARDKELSYPPRSRRADPPHVLRAHFGTPLVAHRRSPTRRYFGFDTGHLGDFMPAMAALLRSLGHRRLALEDRFETYKELHYVRMEVLDLAEQLRDVARIWPCHHHTTHPDDDT